MNTKQSYKKEIERLHGELENEARNLEKVKGSIIASEEQLRSLNDRKSALSATVLELGDKLSTLEKQIYVKNKEIETKRDKESAHLNQVGEEISALQVKVDITKKEIDEVSFITRDNSKIMEENKSLVAENNRLKDSSAAAYASLCQNNRNIDALKIEAQEITDMIREEYQTAFKQIDGLNAKLERVRFYARRLAKSGGKNMEPELKDLGPFKFLPSKKLQLKLDKYVKTNK